MSINVEQLRRRMSIGAVVVVGAGMSLQARYPDTFGLNGLLWDALDADAHARAELAIRLRVPDRPAKVLIGDDFSKWDQAWLTVADSPIARDRFQRGFVALDAGRADRPSPSHEALARLIHSGEVELVVSFNWDSALERAYERLYGVAIPAGVLWKPHGDVSQPDACWLLPHEDGFVDPDLLQQLAKMGAEHPRILVVVGYSESDKAVVDDLIAPLDERWRVCRVSPNAKGIDDIAGKADVVLGALAAPLAQREDKSAWKVVTFGRQRGIEAAMEGQRLLPADVDACPPLPEVDRVVAALQRTFAVVINGESGSGKSITAYQVANRLQQQGYEVLRLRDRAKTLTSREWIADSAAFVGPKLLFVDDAQDLGVDVVDDLVEIADLSTLVLIAGVDHVSGGVVTLTVTGTGAVATLERYVLDHIDELLPKVQALDSQVGDGFGDESLRGRVRSAARQESAWQFFYTLTGGWERTAHTLSEVRGLDRADLAACALAVAQIAGVDSGVTVEQLVPYATALGRDRVWIEQNLAVLQKRRLVVEDDGVWRIVHLRTAYAVLNAMLHPPSTTYSPIPEVTVPAIASADGTKTIAARPAPATRVRPAPPAATEAAIESDRLDAAVLLQCAVSSAATPLRGVAWLVGRGLSTESAWIIRSYGVRSPEIDRSLAERALATPPSGEVGMAAQLLQELAGPEAPIVTETIWKHRDVVLGWVEELVASNGWAVGNLINVLHNDNRQALQDLLDGVDPASVAAVIEAGGWPHIYSSMKAVERIAQGGGVKFLVAVGEAFDETALHRMLDDLPDLSAAGELFSGLAHLNPSLGLRLFESHAGRLAALFSPNPVDRFNDLFETFAFLLQRLTFGDSDYKIPAAVRHATRTFMSALDTGPLVAALVRPKDNVRWHNFEYFVLAFADAAPREWKRVVDALDLDLLEEEFVAQLPRPGDKVLFILYMIAQSRQREVLSLLDRHADGIGAIEAALVHIHPQLCVQLIEGGLPLDLGLYHQRYADAAELLALVGPYSAQVASEVGWANREAFCEGLSRNVQPPFTDLSKWLSAADKWAPGLVEDSLISLGDGTVARWADAMRKPASKKQIGPLIVRAAAAGDTSAAAEAAMLVRQFPSLKRLDSPS
ncbi:hypothetical protein [Nocardia salmonicida]|uniref:hypothetical protein n=1 Tax=Nocardia salmonicida TaxID=53431 RepID=UPI0037BC73A4